MSASEVFHTGIKVIDLLAHLERGGKGGLHGGAGVGKTVLIMEIIHNRVAGDLRPSYSQFEELEISCTFRLVAA